MTRTFTMLPLLLMPLAGAAAQESSGAVRICVAPAVIEASTGDAAILADAVRETLTLFLTGPTLEAVALRAPLESQARQEAATTGCPYVLFTTARHVRNSGSGGLLGRAVGGAVQAGAWTAGAATSSVAGSIAGGVVAGATGAAAMEFAGSVRVKDELALSYQLESAAGDVLVKKSEKRKSKSDGEDLLTPMAGRAAEAIASAVTEQRR